MSELVKQIEQKVHGTVSFLYRFSFCWRVPERPRRFLIFWTLCVITFVFTVLRNWLLRYILYTSCLEDICLCLHVPSKCGQCMVWDWKALQMTWKKRATFSLRSRKWSFRYGKTLISFQSLAFFNISASTHFSASAENTVKVCKGYKIKN